MTDFRKPGTILPALFFVALAFPIAVLSQTNLALNKSVTVSSEENAGYAGTYAVDGDPTNTRWSSTFSDPQWLYVDLGSVQSVSCVILSWEAAYATSYDIQVSSDAVSWTTVYTTTTSPGGTEVISFPATNARYVQMYGRTRVNATWGYSLWEFEVYTMPPSGTNLALHKNVTVSSVENAGLAGSNAVDGDLANTRWSSAFSDPQWLYVDLGSVQTFNTVDLMWEAAYASSYDIQVSNDATNWTTVYSTTTGMGGTEEITFTATSARYVRMYGSVRATPYGYSLWEIEVYNMLSYGTNLALHKAVRASSEYPPDYAAANVVDGSTATEWDSDWADSQWIWVDLGSVQTVDMVVLRWGTNYAPSYRIEVSNDTLNWTEVYATDSNQGGRNDCPFTPVRARYVRLHTLNKATIGSLQLTEFLVYCRTTVGVTTGYRTAVPLPPDASGGCFKVKGDFFRWPGAAQNAAAVAALYDLRGRMLRRIAVSGGVIDICKDFGVSKGVYLLKIGH